MSHDKGNIYNTPKAQRTSYKMWKKDCKFHEPTECCKKKKKKNYLLGMRGTGHPRTCNNYGCKHTTYKRLNLPIFQNVGDYKIPPLRFHRWASSAKRGTFNFLQGQDIIYTVHVLVVSSTYIQVILAGLRRSPVCVVHVKEEGINLIVHDVGIPRGVMHVQIRCFACFFVSNGNK